MDYELTVGLEVHAELATRTKMFCDSKNDPDEERPNVNVCPICMGHPGTLPVINKEAVRSVLLFGTAVEGTLADYTEFDRKNYFYPDIPKGYQISQYKHPLVSGGTLGGINLTRVHLEEDTASSEHLEAGESRINFNRAGAPLMELVTEPVIHTAAEAGRFARELQLLLRTLGISKANMEKGEMRVEANISLARRSLGEGGVEKLGTKVEVKNLNSFRAVEKAIEYERVRQIGLLERGEEVRQETRGWDENKEETFSQRAKEESHDYRYFPDPDLPKLSISEIPEFSSEALRAALPELPWHKRERLVVTGITPEHAEIYVTEPEWGTLYEEVIGLLGDPSQNKLASNYITSELKAPLPASELAKVIRMIASGTLSSRGAKEVIKILTEEGGDAEKIAESHDLIQKSDTEALKKIAEQIINENEKAVSEYKNGKEASLQYLIGQGMRAMKGSGNPQVLREVFLELLK